MPNPENPDAAISTGVAAHITAASAAGPRFDASLTGAERGSASNGIWLCHSCSRVVDGAPDAFLVDQLKLWKRPAEEAAARDARAGHDVIDEAIREISAVEAELLAFSGRWRVGEPEHRFDDWEGSTRRLIQYSHARLAAYHQELTSGITRSVTRAEAILGETHVRVLEAKQSAMAGPTNYFSMTDLAASLERLVEALRTR